MAKLLYAVVLCSLYAPFAASQQLAPVTISQFEVASVKPWSTREINGFYTYPGGRVACRGCTLEFLLEVAFDVQDFQLLGGPAWIKSDRYDIEAKPPASSTSSRLTPAHDYAPPNEEQRNMLQSLLRSRFNLRYHRETTEGPVYLLVRGEGEVKMQEPKDKEAFPWSGGLRGGVISGDGLRGVNESMADLALRLSGYVNRPVLDRTGLVGSFDFRVEYDERLVTQAHSAGDTVSNTSDNAEAQLPGMAPIVLALVQKLGLKLESSKGQLSRIVIESAERPTSN